MNFKLIFIFIVLFSCSKEKFSTIQLYGHGGNGMSIQNSVYHDNSKEAIELALGMEGVNGVEVDVRLSVDGELWLYHDNQLDTETNASGCISEMSSSELSSVTYTTSNKEKLVQFSTLNFELYSGREFLIDARHYNGCDFSAIDYQLFVDKLSELKLAHFSVKFTVLSKFKGWMSLFSAAGFETFYELNSMDEFTQLQAENIPFDGVIVKNLQFDASQIQQLKSNSKKVIIFDVRSPKQIKKAFKKSPDGLLTDDLRAALIEKY